jgi:hypothetical protein
MSRQIGAQDEPFSSIALASHCLQIGAPGQEIEGVSLPSIRQIAQKSVVAVIAATGANRTSLGTRRGYQL